jgi:hypothetical protein
MAAGPEADNRHNVLLNQPHVGARKHDPQQAPKYGGENLTAGNQRARDELYPARCLVCPRAA